MYANWYSGLLAASLFFYWNSAAAQPSDAPTIFTKNAAGDSVPVEEENLTCFEYSLLEQFRRSNPPLEIIALSSGRLSDFSPPFNDAVSSTCVVIYKDYGELQWRAGDDAERYRRRKMSQQEVSEFRKCLANHKTNQLPSLGAEKKKRAGAVTIIVGGVQYVYLHINRQRGVRISINNPQDEDRDIPLRLLKDYQKTIQCFTSLLKLDQMEVKYSFRRPVRGLEVLYAHPDREVLAVWKQGRDLGVTVRDKRDWAAKKEYRRFDNKKLREPIAAPATVKKNALAIGDITLQPALSSSDGRWIVGNRSPDETFACYDSQQKKWIPVADREIRTKAYPLYYWEPHQVFLLGKLSPARAPTSDWRGLSELQCFRPETGKLVPLEELQGVGLLTILDKSLWLQNTPRPLQPVRGKQNVVWVAAPSENATRIGQFDLKTLRWRRFAYIPHLKFESKDIWIDENHDWVYIAYKAHLLRFDLPFDLSLNKETNQ